MPRELKTIKVSYLDPDTQDVKTGEFSLRRLMAGEITNLISLCQRRNSKTGAVIETDEAKFSKLWLAESIFDCPIVFEKRAWKEMDLSGRTQAIDKCLEEDMFTVIAQSAKAMRRVTEETENLS
jgi:hypothetical protein